MALKIHDCGFGSLFTFAASPLSFNLATLASRGIHFGRLERGIKRIPRPRTSTRRQCVHSILHTLANHHHHVQTMNSQRPTNWIGRTTKLMTMLHAIIKYNITNVLLAIHLV
jgi:hypothetical protein